MSTLFLNASPNKDGNTVRLAHTLLGNTGYDELDLADYKVYGYGQPFADSADDQFDEVLAAVKGADAIVIGSPMYWHNITGLLRNFFDRCYGPVQPGELAGKRVFFLFQGAAPEKWQLEAAEFTVSRFAGLYGAEYVGMATNAREAKNELKWAAHFSSFERGTV